MLAFQTTPIKVHIIEIESLICSCCKDELSVVEDLYIKLSCGHEYHYDCIYSAFIANKKRSNNILECPYCRKKVKPLPEKAGFNYDSSIHAGININGLSNKVQYKWMTQHMGSDYCLYCKDGKYCNYQGVGYGLSKKYCFQHHNVEHFGESNCIFKNKDKYCNLNVSLDSKPYCYCHKQYASAKECKYVFQSGISKGQICKKLTLEECGLCKGHMKHKDNIGKLLEKSAEKSSELVEKYICSEIIKSGLNKGKPCGIINCKRHKKAELVIEPQVNSTKIVELKGLENSPIIIHVEKSAEETSNDPIILEKYDILLIKDTLFKLNNKLDLEGQQILNSIITKYFQ